MGRGSGAVDTFGLPPEMLHREDQDQLATATWEAMEAAIMARLAVLHPMTPATGYPNECATSAALSLYAAIRVDRPNLPLQLVREMAAAHVVGPLRRRPPRPIPGGG